MRDAQRFPAQLEKLILVNSSGFRQIPGGGAPDRAFQTHAEVTVQSIR